MNIAILLYLISTLAFAQELKPVIGPGSGTLSAFAVAAIGGALAAVVLIVGWYYGIHKPGKDAEAKTAVTDAVAEMSALLHKAHDLIAKQHDVIASPPVQAAINATPPAAAPTAAPTPSGSPTAAPFAAPSTAVPPWER